MVGRTRSRMVLACALAFQIAGGFANAEGGAAIGRSAVEAGNIGLFSANDFRIVKGKCSDCPTIPQALWYFQDDLVAVPGPGVGISGMTLRAALRDEVRQWFSKASPDDLAARPPLVWVGAPNILSDVRLEAKERQLRLRDGAVVGFKLTPKIATNRSYFNEKTVAFFEQRPLRVRGHVEQTPSGAPVFVARTVWPQDYVIDAARLKLAPLSGSETLMGLIRREPTADKENYEVRLLWERNPGQPRHWDQLAVIGALLNGAQGDDDEAHAGHFAMVTGRIGAGGEWADWIVDNFYNLDSFSEKGIVAAMVPMDNYQMDLNSGQSYYRPSYMLVALLKSGRAAYAYQGAIQRVYNRFYRHDFLYDHSASNCAGISIDTLRAIGWEVPTRGATSYVKAVVAYPYKALQEMSLESGRKAFSYLKEEQTRLYPAAAFDAIGGDLLQLVGAVPGQQRAMNAFEKALSDDVEAVIYVRIPQIPSSRAYGRFPVASIDEYMARVPEEKSKWQIVPVDPRPFPKEFGDAEALQEHPDYASMGAAWAGALIVVALVAWRLRRRSGVK